MRETNRGITGSRNRVRRRGRWRAVPHRLDGVGGRIDDRFVYRERGRLRRAERGLDVVPPVADADRPGAARRDRRRRATVETRGRSPGVYRVDDRPDATRQRRTAHHGACDRRGSVDEDARVAVTANDECRDGTACSTRRRSRSGRSDGRKRSSPACGRGATTDGRTDSRDRTTAVRRSPETERARPCGRPAIDSCRLSRPRAPSIPTPRGSWPSVRRYPPSGARRR